MCLYSGCHSVFVPDITFGLKRKWKVIVYIFQMPFWIYAGCPFCKKRQWKCIVFIFRRQLCLYAGCNFCYDTKAMKVHCVYIPDVIVSICRMTLLLEQKHRKCIVYVFRMPLCLYSGCHFCLPRQWTCIVFIFWMSFCLHAKCHFWFKKTLNVHCV